MLVDKMTESAEFFTELLFGNGAWLGLAILLGILFLISIKVKYFGLFASVMSFFLGIQYFQTVTGASDLNWCGILCMLSIPFYLLITFKGRDTGF